MIFRELNATETREFQQWALANYEPGEPIDRELWHPVIVAQCDAINAAPLVDD
jgi:hypothetical protein